MKKRILFVVNELSFFISHRLNIALAAKKEGYKVKIAYGEVAKKKEKILIQKKGIECFEIPLYRSSLNPLRELWSFFSILYNFYLFKPDIVHLITIKAYLYGGIAARLVRVPCVVSSIAGLGSFFHRKNLKNLIFKSLMYPIFHLAFRHPNQYTIVQNLEDKKILGNWGVLNFKKVHLIKGSGVELKKFFNLNEKKTIVTVCFASRLLKDKGVYDFVDAANLIKKRGLKARFLLVGSVDLDNPTSLTNRELNNIRNQQAVEVLGFKKNIAKLYSECHVVCLPSFFGEGIPKALIEAGAASRAIVTTNHPGCRDAIIPNKTGILVPIKSPKKLADAIQWLIEKPKERKKMGKAGRKLAEKIFPINKISQQHIKIYHALLRNCNLV